MRMALPIWNYSLRTRHVAFLLILMTFTLHLARWEIAHSHLCKLATIDTQLQVG